MYFPYYTYMVIIFFEQDFDRFQQIALSRIHLYVSKNVYMSFLESQQELESSKKHTETIPQCKEDKCSRCYGKK